MQPSDPAALPAKDPVQRLVAELDHLRGATGMASYRKLAARTHYSRSALWRATRGSRLPSRDITLALASACGGDIAEWDRKWPPALRPPLPRRRQHLLLLSRARPSGVLRAPGRWLCSPRPPSCLGR